MNSLETKNVRRDYIVPDCQVHRYSYEVMTNIKPGSPPTEVGGGDVDTPGDPAKEYKPWFGIWDDEGFLDDDGGLLNDKL